MENKEKWVLGRNWGLLKWKLESMMGLIMMFSDEKLFELYDFSERAKINLFNAHLGKEALKHQIRRGGH